MHDTHAVAQTYLSNRVTKYAILKRGTVVPRWPRIVVPGEPMHITHRGHNRAATFRSDSDREYYLDALRSASHRARCSIHAYVLMTNHIHLLVTPEDRDCTARMLKMVGSRYVRYHNAAYAQTGTLWEGRYRSALIDSAYYFLACSRYIDCNPVRARMVSRPEEYLWSSYRALALGHPDTLVTPHVSYRALGLTASARQSAYTALCAASVPDTRLAEVRHATDGGSVLGSAAFHARVEGRIGRPTERRLHGGDRRSAALVG